MPEHDPDIFVLRSAERYRTVRDGIETRHCFSFGDHYDPANIGFGDLTAVNDESLDPGSGYDAHRHRDAEIVTWVLDGALEHEDSAGNRGTIRPGMIQRMSAGAGVEHAERNASTGRPLRFIQMWLRSDGGDTPTYEQADLTELLTGSGFVLAVAGADDAAAIGIGRAGARLWIGRFDDDAAIALPDAPLRHLHVVRGGVDCDEQPELAAGDTMRIAGPGEHRIATRGPTEILLWGMRRSS